MLISKYRVLWTLVTELFLLVNVEQVASPEPERKNESAESPETTNSSLPPQVGPRSLPPQTSPPSLPEMDFFHSDPFTDRRPQILSLDNSGNTNMCSEHSVFS